MYKCEYCTYSSNWIFNLTRHQKNMHKEIYNNNTLSPVNLDIYDVRLKENFKLFISRPSRCVKTIFVSNLLDRINEFSKIPPTGVSSVYKVWQNMRR